MRLYFKYVAMQLKADLEYKKAFALSLLSGYTFFSSSSVIMIISINTILFIKMQKIKRKNIEQDVKLKGIK